jgi:hypothetical protein
MPLEGDRRFGLNSLASTKLTVILCLVLAACGIAGSILYRGNTAVDGRGTFNIFRSPLFLAPAGLLVLNILSCAWKRFPAPSPLRARRWTFAGIHAGIVLLAAGLAVDGLFGFVGTRNLYRGVPEAAYFDWRKNREETFPFTIEVTEALTRNYPLNLQVGVSDAGGSRIGVFTVREGGTFVAGKTGISVTPRRFEPESRTLFFDASVGGRSFRGLRADPSGIPLEGGYVVAPVAFADPEPMEYVAAVRFAAPGRAPEDFEIRINAPVVFDGITFCLVAVGEDRYGNPYAGLQMTREPGAPFFWAGALLFGLSVVAHPRGKRKLSVAAGLALLLPVCAFAAGAESPGAAIEGETTWKGEVRIVRPVTVARGATLRILPGTRILLSGEDRDSDGVPDGRLVVDGAIHVEGERGRPVRFERLHPDKAWDEIFLMEARAVIRHAVFEGANWGLHVHEGNVKVEHAVFRKNGGGARLKGTGTLFTRCTFKDNGTALRFRDGGPVVRSSSVVGNDTGLFYREGSGGGKITGNRIASREWDLKLGDWAAGALDVSGNYWSAGGARVGDFRERKEGGRLVLLPALPAPPDPCGADLGEGE